MGSILAFRAPSGPVGGRSEGGGGHTHTVQRGAYPQGFGAASGYPQGVSWRLNAPASGGIVGS